MKTELPINVRTLAGPALLLGLWPVALLSAAEPAAPAFRPVDIDTKIEIGYGVTVADVDGDRRPDILLADKKQFLWYRNPGWEKYVLADNLTRLDNVCITAADVDGDGQAEVAVGGEWNPNDTTGSGAVFYLVAPKDRTQRWSPVQLPHEPTVHRMRWVRNTGGKFDLVVVPLHGRGNQSGQGAGVRIVAYKMPPDPKAPWQSELIDDALHLTHNFDVIKWSRQPGDELLVAGREGVFHLVPQADKWKRWQLVGNEGGETNFNGAGEVRQCRLHRRHVIATIEPMHGHQVVVYTPPSANDSSPLWKRNVLDDSLIQGHALACGDLLGLGTDQIVAGWRGNKSGDKVGIKLFIPLDDQGARWKQVIVDENTMACEDLCLADLNADGKLDIVAAGRATKNLKVYFNQGVKTD
jgi:hypothetical protein